MPDKRKLLVALAAAASLAVGAQQAHAASAADIDRDSRAALDKLMAEHPSAARLAHQAKGVLIFPNIVKAGLVFGGSYGEGELIENGQVHGYYSTGSASWGLQAGAQSYGYALFLMDDAALQYAHDTHRWQLGAGPTIAVVDSGMEANLTTTQLNSDSYAYVFGQQGLMAGVTVQGSKVTRLDK
ncbi:MAG TPA: lipid-binding SYLF domain-containing protein [Caulobacteraceae bacterium]|nr:lipid-binding SYLF domain-containing protein [Caulobacteraceae bacterium]